MSSLPLVERLASVPDPIEAAACFADLPYLLLLDSAADPQRTGRFSFLSADPSTVVRSRGKDAERLASSGVRWTPVAGDALAEVRRWLAPYRHEPIPGMPPFQGGAAGYIGYDWGATLEQLPKTRYDDLHLWDVVLGLYDWVIAWDHCEHAAWIVSPACPTVQRTGPRGLRSGRQWYAAGSQADPPHAGPSTVPSHRRQQHRATQ
jgi:para-aminobenzoate synthetase component I